MSSRLSVTKTIGEAEGEEATDSEVQDDVKLELLMECAEAASHRLLKPLSQYDNEGRQHGLLPEVGL